MTGAPSPEPTTPRRICVLLSTFNGAAFLSPQLGSLAAQTMPDWNLLVRDDGSTDASRELVLDFAAAHPGRAAVLPSDAGRLGAAASFGALLAAADARYYFFCDQDDVWLPRKIELTLAAMRALEHVHGPARPLVVHTDLAVTDAALRPIAPSLWRYQGAHPAHSSKLNRLLVQNYATGSTIALNRACRDLAIPIPPEAVMHDWWVALVAAALGAVGWVPEPLVLYRQHASNDLGARAFNPREVIRSLSRRTAILHAIARTHRQAAAFLARYHGRLTAEQLEMLSAYADLRQQAFFVRRLRMLRHAFFYSGLARNVGRLLLS